VPNWHRRSPTKKSCGAIEIDTRGNLYRSLGTRGIRTAGVGMLHSVKSELLEKKANVEPTCSRHCDGTASQLSGCFWMMGVDG